jgi:hypothetical protein
MGTRPMEPTEAFLVDRLRDDELHLKQRLLADRHADVVATLPGSEAAGRLVLDLVLAAVVDAGLVDVDGATLRDLSTGIEVGVDRWHPVDAAARLVQEDLCLMERGEDGVWRLTAASVCFPSRWRLADKIGRSLSAIHDPVPDYDRIRAATDRLFDRLDPQRPVKRSNWTLLDDAALFQPRPEGRKGDGPRFDTDLPTVLQRVHLRVERQTVRSLAPGAALFTIRTSVDPLTALDAAERAALAATARTVDAATVAYKGWSQLLPTVLVALGDGA